MKQSERLMEVEEKAGSSKMIDSQCLGLSHPTSRKSLLNYQKLTCFAIVFSDWNNTIFEKNILYIRKFIQFICFFYIYTTVYSFGYLSESSHLIMNLDSALCTIVESISFLLYYPLNIFTHYSFTYKYFFVISRVNYNNILLDSSVPVGLL